MMKGLTLYSRLAELFYYPEEDYPQVVKGCIELLRDRYPQAAEHLVAFEHNLPRHDVWAMQELFVRSFDVQSMTTLDVGYVLFGDDYKRGELLANLNREFLAAQVDCRNELADHLPNLLRLLPTLQDADVVAEMVQDLLAPALAAMIAEFSCERINVKNESYQKHYKTLIEIPGNRIEKQTVYVHVLRALDSVIREDFAIPEWVAQVRADDFLASVQRENIIEERSETPNYAQEDIKEMKSHVLAQ